MATVPGGDRRAVRAGDPADPETDAYVPPDPMLKIDRDTMRRLGELADARCEDESRAVAAAVKAYHATVIPPEAHLTGAASTVRPGPSIPNQPKETHTMRIAVKSTGGITESFVHVENIEEGAKEAAKQIAEDYGLPTDIELWSDHPDAGAPRKLGELRFVAVDGAGNVVELD